MTPPPAAAATARRAAATHPARERPRPRRAPAPRRVSGPAGGLRVVRAAAGAVHTVAEHRFLDRIIRGRMWIGILGVGLIGIVFMQVSMLRMNAGIGRAVEQASTLERKNAALQASISQLSSGERLEAAAEKLGFVLPAAGSTRFLDAHDVNVRKAINGIEPPGSHPPEPAITAPTAALTIGETGVAPSENDTQAAAPPAATGEQGAATTATTTAPAAQPAQQPAATPTQQQPQQAAATQVATSGGTAPGQGR